MQIEFDPPRRGWIEHTLDDGSVESVECLIETHYTTAGQYWVRYTDPEDDQTEIADSFMVEDVTMRDWML